MARCVAVKAERCGGSRRVQELNYYVRLHVSTMKTSLVLCTKIFGAPRSRALAVLFHATGQSILRLRNALLSAYSCNSKHVSVAAQQGARCSGARGKRQACGPPRVCPARARFSPQCDCPGR